MTTYTDPVLITGVRVTEAPIHRGSVTGYGGAIPTAHMVRYAGRWRRVYVMVYGNGTTPYIKVRGVNTILDVDTRHKIREN